MCPLLVIASNIAHTTRIMLIKERCVPNVFHLSVENRKRSLINQYYLSFRMPLLLPLIVTVQPKPLECWTTFLRRSMDGTLGSVMREAGAHPLSQL